jgi:glycosyltransferase 2 family protein
MRARLGKWWPVLKALFAVAIVAAIGRRFFHDLTGSPELWQRPLHAGWLLLSGVLYLVGLGFSAVYWRRLLRVLGQRLPLLTAFRAYYLGHMGKYLPGKAWALFLRAGLARGAGVRTGLAVMTSFYEVLTTMAAGALLAALLFGLFAWRAPGESAAIDWPAFRGLLLGRANASVLADPRLPALMALVMLGPVGLPIVPSVFNRIVRRMALPFREADAAPPPRIHLTWTCEGLLITGVGWLFLGGSSWAVLRAMLPDLPWDWEALARLTAIMGLAYVAGFIIVLVPSGFGIRELFLVLFLTPEIERLTGMAAKPAHATAILGAIVLRLVWTAAEVVLVGTLYWLPGAPPRAEDRGASIETREAPLSILDSRSSLLDSQGRLS